MRPGVSGRSSIWHRLLSLFVAATTAVGALLAVIPPAPVQAAPVLGGQIFSTGAAVEVEVLPASAGLTSELWLLEPEEIFIATNRQVGSIVEIGPYPTGVELIFGIRVGGNEFRIGPGDRNPDGIAHATVDFTSETTAIVGFEDLFGGGDRDFNDNRFEFRGGIAPEPPPEPEPEPEPTPGTPPVAAAGPDQEVPEGSVVQLDATGSSDPGGGGLIPSEASANLPGGTALETALDQLSPPGGGTQTLQGSAAVGEGDAVANTALVYVFDLSASTRSGGGCGGDVNGDGITNSRLDCEIAAARRLNTQAVASGTVAEVGLIGFSSNGLVADVSPADGLQSLTGPGTDHDEDGTPDIEQVMVSSFSDRAGRPVGFNLFTHRSVANNVTNFSGGISSACALLAGSTQPNRLVVFLSDGENNGGEHVANVLPCEPQAAFHTFAAGPAISCASNPSRGGLQTIADLTDGTCTNVNDLNALPDILEDLVGSRLTRLELTIDGGDPIDISGAADPALPVDGPASVSITYSLPELDNGLHEICLTAYGSDAGGEGSVTTCSEVGGGGQLTYRWELIESDGPPIFPSSTTDPQPTFTAADDAVYSFELTVTNGFGLTDTDRVVVTVDNLAPTLSIESSESTARSVTLVNASFTDPGWLDTHEALIDWGDGSDTDSVPVNAQGAGWGGFFGSHIYADAGNYTITATVTDDDGGTSSAATVELSVAEPVAVWANAQTSTKTLDWSGAAGSITGRVHTNGQLRAVGDTKTVIGPSTYAGSLAADTDKHIFVPLPAQAPVQDYPFRFELADYVPGGPVATAVGSAYHDMSAECIDGTWHAINVVLDSGVYYADCDVQINGSSVGGRITLAATGSISVSGSRPAFEPYYDGLLFLAGETGKAIDLAASSSKFLGYLFAEFGEIEVSGSDDRFFCGILGDRVDLSGGGINVRGAACGRPASTTAGPLLVPELGLNLAGSPDDVLPGASIDYELTVSNDGGLLVVPGLLGLENVDSATATTASYGYTLEYFSIPGGAWLPLASAAGAVDGYAPTEPLPTTGGITLDVRPNPFAGVTYPTSGDLLLGASIDPGGFATWGYQALVDLTPEQVALLMDDTRVGGLRNQIAFELTPSTVQVRRLFRYGADFVTDVRALSGDITEVEITSTRPTGDPTFLDAGTNRELARLGPGASVTIPDAYSVALVDPPGDGESDTAYLGRLLAVDEASLFAAAFARASGGVGLLLAPQVHVGATEHAPVVEVTKDGPASALAGATLDYDITLENRGSVDATDIALADRLDDQPLAIDAVPNTLVPGQIATSAASYAVPGDQPGGTLTNRAEATWTDAAGNVYGPLGDEVATDVQKPPNLSATLADALAVDADTNGVVSPGDTIAYEAVIRNDGDAPLNDVAFDIVVDSRAMLDPASVTTSTGAITDGTDSGDDHITVAIPQLAGHALASIHFDLVIADPFDFPSAILTMQGTVTSSELDPVLTDDPARPGPDDPTLTHVVIPAPLLVASLTDALAIDRDGDGGPSPDDTLRYTATVENQGSAPATDVSIMLAPDANSTLLTGSVTTSSGTIAEGGDSGDTFVRVDLDSLAALETLAVNFEVRIADPFPAGADRLSVQGIVNATEVGDPIVTDDPDTATEADPTVTLLGFGGGGPGNGLPGPTIGEVAPAEGASVTEPTTISATLTPPDGETVESWTVSYRLEGDDARTEIASGTVTAVEATLDPTVMPNGAYVIEIEATASGGGVSVASTSLIVEGNLKLGRFQVTYQDLNISVGGIPIRVLRTYDSFDKSRGDFGIGWQLELANFRIATNGPLGAGGWTMFGCGSGLIFVPLCFESDRPHYVTVTWPDGRVETFDLTPAQGSTFLPGLTSAHFSGRPGSTSKLTATDSGLYWSGDGNLYGGLFGSGGLYNPTRFRLTDRFGTEYILEVGRGLISARDRNGNTVTVSQDGITSSLGPSVAFDRDALGRVTAVSAPDGSYLTYAYDSAGDLVGATDQGGRSSSFEYDAAHNLTDIIDPLGRPFRQMEYAPDGRVIAIVDALGQRTEVDLDPASRQETVTDPSGRLTTVTTFDDHGYAKQVDRIFDGTTQTWEFSYDALGDLLSRTDPLGHVWTFTFDNRGNRLSSVDPAGNTSTWTYNEFGEVLTAADRAGGVTTFTYDDVGNLASVTDPEGSTATFEYDAAGHRTRQVNDLGDDRTWTYTSAGLVSSVVDELGRTTAFAYDAAGRPTSQTDARGSTVTLEYEATGLISAVVDGNGNRTTYTYDDGGQIIDITDAAGGHVRFAYDDAGRLTTVTDANGSTHSYSYDADDRLVSEITGGAETSFVYDGAGRLIKRTDGRGEAVTFSYDSADRLIEMASDEATVGYTYDALDHRASMSDATGTTSWSYDELGRITTVTSPSGSISYTYDGRGKRTSMTLPAGEVTYSYDSIGRLSEVEDWLGGVHEYSYDAASQLESVGRPNGVTTTYTYDIAGNVLSLVHSGPSGVLARFDYSYDAAGNRVSMTTGPGTETYTLDELNRITAVAYPDGSAVGYSYDAAGNRTAMTSGPSTTTYAYDANGRLTAVTVGGSASTVMHDAAGNVTVLGDRTYAWDAFGRLASTAGGLAAAAYSYDGDGLRVAQTVDGQMTSFLWDRALDVPEVVSDGQRTVLDIPGSQVVFDGTNVQYALADALGSARLLTDADATAVGSAAYDAFGSIRSHSGEPPFLGFAGEMTDATGLVYLRARSYVPSLGRFLSQDPAQPNAPGTQGWNLYSYAVDNPTTYTDPLGMSPFVEFSLKNALIGGGLGIATRGLPAALSTCREGPEDAYITCVVNAAAAGGLVGFASGGFGAALEGVVLKSFLCAGAGLFSVSEDFAYAGLTHGNPPSGSDAAVSFLVGCGLALVTSNFGPPTGGNPPGVPAFGTP